MDYFTARERRVKQRFVGYRDRLVRPLVRVLAAGGISPNMISLTGVLLVLALPWASDWHVSLLLLLGYVLLDGLDGPLARYLGDPTQGGSVVDLVCDQIGLIVVTTVAVWRLSLPETTALFFVGFYISAITLAIYCNSIAIGFSPVVRLKYPLYVAYVIALVGYTQALKIIITIGSFYYPVISLMLVRKIYFHYQKKR